jgi:hypothetical protein
MIGEGVGVKVILRELGGRKGRDRAWKAAVGSVAYILSHLVSMYSFKRCCVESRVPGRKASRWVKSKNGRRQRPRSNGS